MSGIYIHIPFCSQKCAYCDFYSISDFSLKNRYVQALKKEIKFRASYLNSTDIQSLYIGGGTPSMLSASDIEQITNYIDKFFSLSPQAEITLEANPNNLTNSYLSELKTTAINRLSIGIQSFHKDDLKVLGRIHSVKQAEKSINLAYKHGFSNLSVDLMYGFPGLNTSKWEHNLHKVKDIAHISCYQLGIKENTPLSQQISTQKQRLFLEKQIKEQYFFLIDFAKKHDFIHYETSNFCKKNREAKHNSSYWKGIPYLGLGPGAHSFNRTSRQWNFSNVENYISLLENAENYSETVQNALFEKEILSTDMQYNEYIMIRLRTIWGADLQYIQQQFGKQYLFHLHQQLKKVKPAHFKIQSNTLLLTEEGGLFADLIASTLFI